METAIVIVTILVILTGCYVKVIRRNKSGDECDEW